jgi:predicted acylesterase/phospholipase RssA
MTMTDGINPRGGPAPTAPPIGLCLSGGGFRATLFHLGVLRLLWRAELWPSVQAICSVSGGSILAAHAVLNWELYRSDFSTAAAPLLDFIRRDVRGRLVRRFPRSRTRMIQRLYAELYGYQKLQALRGKDRPDLYVLATNLNDGSPCCFTGDGFAPSLDRLRDPIVSSDTPVALAVASSSALPVVFAPVEIDDAKLRTAASELAGRTLFLTDGGVYDNLGVKALTSVLANEPGTQRIFSDASLAFDWNDLKQLWPPQRAIQTAWRAYDIGANRVRENELSTVERQPEWAPIKISETTTSGIDSNVQRQLRFVRTDLDVFSAAEINALVQHGYSVARQQLSDVPSLAWWVTRTPVEPWDPIPRTSGRTVALDSTILYRSRYRRLRLFSIRDPLTPINVALLLVVLTLGSVWWTTRRVVPSSVAIASSGVYGPMRKSWVSEHHWLPLKARALALEAGQTAPDETAHLVQSETTVLPRSKSFSVRVSVPPPYRVSGEAYLVRHDRPGTTVVPLGLGPTDNASATFDVWEAEDGDSLLLLAVIRGPTSVPVPTESEQLKRLIRLEIIK